MGLGARPLEGGGKGIPCLCCFDGLKRSIVVSTGLYKSCEILEGNKNEYLGPSPWCAMVDMVGL